MMEYLRNAWYVAAWSDEVAPGEILARTIMDEPVAVFRTADGSPAAVLDQCPHRFAPFSAGSIKDGVLVCGYHGLGFDRDGRCVVNPHGPVPRNGAVKSYPITDKYKAAWIWMGEAADADPGLIPDLAFLEEAPASAFSEGKLLSGKGDYQLYVDNIMDLSHVDYVHPDTLGGGAVTQARQEIEEAEDYIDVTWRTPDTAPPPLLAAIIGDLPERADAYQRVRWLAPSVMKLVAGVVPTEASEAEGALNFNAHIMTPETKNTTHYFFAATRNFRREDAALNAKIAARREEIFRTEDKPMIEKVAMRMGDSEFWSLKPMLLSIDGASVRVRRRLERLIAAENARVAATAGPVLARTA